MKLQKQRKSKERKLNIKMEHWKVIAFYLMVYDAIIINLSYALVLWLRFDCNYTAIPMEYIKAWIQFVPIYTMFSLMVFWYFRLYQSIWRFASYSELARVLLASVITSFFHAAAITILYIRMPVTYYIFGALLQFMFVIGIRFAYRFILLERSRKNANEHDIRVKHVMLIGAGSAGQMILRDVQSANELNEKVCCIIDDNSNKWNRYIDIGQDHLCFSAEHKICFSVGNDYQGEDNYVVICSPETTTIEHAYQVIGSYSIEGICIIGSTLYVANDGNYHEAKINNNYIATYDISD